MAIDLSLTIVPAEFMQLAQKANQDAGYTEWLAFAPSFLQEQNMNTFGDNDAILVKRDLNNLKQYHKFSPDDFFYDEARCTGTLDYLMDREIESRRLNMPTGLIREAGTVIDENLKGGQGIPLKIYSRELIEIIYGFISTIEFDNLVKHYDDKKMVAFGVYKLQAGNQEYVAKAFTDVKNIFKRAFLHPDTLVLKKMD